MARAHVSSAVTSSFLTVPLAAVPEAPGESACLPVQTSGRPAADGTGSGPCFLEAVLHP